VTQRHKGAAGRAGAARLARLARVARLHAEAARAKAGRALRDEARLAETLASLDAARAAALSQMDARAAPDPATVAAMGAYLRKSEADRARLNVQLAALRARSQTSHREAAKAAARQHIVERLAGRAEP
jgi:hypothetical protein